MLVCFLVFYRLKEKHLALLMDVVSRFKSFSEAPRLARKCGTHRTDEVMVSRPNLCYCIPLCGLFAVIQLVRNQGHEAE
jgi:hypothetical protein